MSELPEGWCSTALGNLAEFINGAAFKPEDWHSFGKPIIRIQNLTDVDKPLNLTRRIIEPKYHIRPVAKVGAVSGFPKAA